MPIMKEGSKPENKEAEIIIDQEDSFGQYLRALRKARGVSVRQLASKVHKTPTYISDIENGNNHPPERILLEQIIEALDLETLSYSIKNKLYDLAAAGRNDVSADIAGYIMSDDIIREVIRGVQGSPNPDELWIKFSSIIKDGGKSNG